MRYSEGPTTEVSTAINATPEQVWALVSDIATPVRFSQELQATEWIDDGDSPTVGSRFKGRNKRDDIGEWEVTCTLIEHKPSEVFAWAAGDVDNPAARWWFRIAPNDPDSNAGAVTLSQQVILGPGPSGLSAAIERMPDKEAKIIQNRLNDLATNMQANLDGIKALVENGAG